VTLAALELFMQCMGQDPGLPRGRGGAELDDRDQDIGGAITQLGVYTYDGDAPHIHITLSSPF
jgi:hypothetical protein